MPSVAAISQSRSSGSSILADLRRLKCSDGEAQTHKDSHRQLKLRLVPKGLPQLTPPQSSASEEDHMDVLDDMLQEWGRNFPPFSIEEIKEQLVNCVTLNKPDEQSQVSVLCADKDSDEFFIGIRDNNGVPIPESSAAAKLTIPIAFPALAMESNGGAKVKAAHISLMDNDSLEDLAFCDFNVPNSAGQTTLAILTHRQDLAGVKYCSLFIPDGDGSLFAPLAEAALLRSDEIFLFLLEKICRNGGAEIQFVDRPLRGWEFLSADLRQFEGFSLEQALMLYGTQPRRYELIKRAKAICGESA